MHLCSPSCQSSGRLITGLPFFRGAVLRVSDRKPPAVKLPSTRPEVTGPIYIEAMADMHKLDLYARHKDEYVATDGPVLVDVRVTREENTYPMIPAGSAAREMVG